MRGFARLIDETQFAKQQSFIGQESSLTELGIAMREINTSLHVDALASLGLSALQTGVSVSASYIFTWVWLFISLLALNPLIHQTFGVNQSTDFMRFLGNYIRGVPARAADTAR